MAISKLRLAIICITTISAAIMELIDTSITNVALNNISGTLGATLEDASWIITAYAIANVIIIPLTGFLSRFFGRKNYYLTSIIIFTIASYMCGHASSLWTLVSWRFIQGIGGGALISVSQSILFEAFPPQKIGMASGIFAMGIVIGPTIGPILGGYIVDNYTWSLIFEINVPIGIIASFLTWRYIDRKEDEYHIDRRKIPIDFVGITSLIFGIGALQYVLEKGQSKDWMDDSTIRYLTVVAVLGIGLFIYTELTAKNPVINLKVLRNRNLIGSNVLTFVVGFGMYGSVYLFPVMVQRIMGFTPTDAGMALMPSALVTIFIMPVIGGSISKGFPPIIYVITGFVLFILHGYTASLATADSGKWWFILTQIFRGIGTAFLVVPLISQAVVGLQPKEMPYGIALTNMFRQLGGAFGIAAINTYVIRRYATHRSDLVSDVQANNPLVTQRISDISHAMITKGINPYMAQTKGAYSILDLNIDTQSQLIAYLDGFILISIFFLCSIPFLLLLKNKKLNTAQRAEAASGAH
ncbi:MAG TPA: DHA2 family efflux MFS transporter permease subunit [Puia sp.]|nr:DHA2 family efflux MFS transporter permease subunit [Puia sp.]